VAVTRSKRFPCPTAQSALQSSKRCVLSTLSSTSQGKRDNHGKLDDCTKRMSDQKNDRRTTTGRMSLEETGRQTRCMSGTGDRWELGNKPGRENGSPSVSEILQEINDNCSSLLKTMNKGKRDRVSQR